MDVQGVAVSVAGFQACLCAPNPFVQHQELFYVANELRSQLNCLMLCAVPAPDDRRLVGVARAVTSMVRVRVRECVAAVTNAARCRRTC